MMDVPSERKHIPGEVVAEVYPVVRVDLGCGKKKQPGFVGIDRFALLGVDIVADMNKGLPLADNSVDYLVASHSLEHIDDLLLTMQEIYRVCKHKALVCVVAPYYHTSANMANPFHTQVFNEHTPRFFTTSNWTPLNKSDYESPGIPEWGLAESDHSKCTIDFRCLRMEMFYFPQYRRLDESEKRRVRQSLLNVVDTIMYHFLVVKEPLLDQELEHIARNIKYEEPTYYTLRRREEELDTKVLPEQLYERGRDYVEAHGIRHFLKRAPGYALSSIRRKMTTQKSKR
jgi:SAM-dependent methyltransferase